jgi:hypothetical protein
MRLTLFARPALVGGLLALAVGCAAGGRTEGDAPAARWWGGCTEAADRPVADFARRALGTPARAGFATGGHASIEYDPDGVPGLSRDAHRFLYLRQCGLHALGRVPARGAPPVDAERDADCWAARALVRADGRTAEDVGRLSAEFTGGGASALTGPPRTPDLAACLGPGGAPEEPPCALTTAFENRVEYETQLVSEHVPCTHCSTVGGARRCAHLQDEVRVPRQVPVARPAPVTRRRCE